MRYVLPGVVCLMLLLPACRTDSPPPTPMPAPHPADPPLSPPRPTVGMAPAPALCVTPGGGWRC
jgi:hypothetical protein